MNGLAVTLLLCIAATFIALYLIQFVHFTGRYVWIAGVLFILTRELGNAHRSDDVTPAS